MNKIIILGTGGHASVVADLAETLNLKIQGFLTNDPEMTGQKFMGYPVLGSDEALGKMDSDTHQVVIGIGTTGSTSKREEIVGKIVRQGFKMPTLISPCALISAHAKMGMGSQIMSGAIIQTEAAIGDHCIINTGAIIEHHVKMEDGVHVAPGAILCGAVTVGKGAFIGAGATVKQGIRIGRNACVGAGAVVLSDVDENTTVVGIPARDLKK
jgi:UDP-perosamine 4-acetyltransferase